MTRMVRPHSSSYEGVSIIQAINQYSHDYRGTKIVGDKSIIERPTVNVRWLKTGIRQPVLQQEWETLTFEAGNLIDIVTDWRDVEEIDN